MPYRKLLLWIVALWLVNCGGSTAESELEERLDAVERNVAAIVQATVEALSGAQGVTPTPDVEARILQPTPALTPALTATPASTSRSKPATPLAQLSVIPTVTPVSTVISNPTRTPRPTSTLSPIATATPIPTPPPRPTSTPRPTATATLIPTPTRVPTPATVQALVQQSLPSVARIATEAGAGTGFVYEVRGTKAHLATNAHVVGDSQQVTVELDGETFVGQVLGTDDVADVAAVEVCCGEFRALRLSGSTEVGQEVVAIGYALGLKGDPTVTRGIVSAKRRHIPSDTNVIQTDATINRGNSGGPMLSLDGSVIGMSTWKLSGGTIESVGFAVMAVEVGLRVAALANPDTIIYAGRQFERVAGPLDVVVAGHGETDKGLPEYFTYVRAEEFVIDSTLSGAEETLTYYINATRGDQLFPGKEGIAVREVGCVRILLKRDGESWRFDLVVGQATARWRVGATVRMYVVAEESKVYIDGELHCEAKWGFGRAGIISLPGLAGNVGSRYSDLSIWMELVDSQSLLNGRSGAVLATPTVEITPVATSTPESPDTPTSTADVGIGVGNLASEFALRLVDGTEITSTELRMEGRPAFVYFLAGW